jgi:DNA-binding response OmpR family regulator
MSPDLDAAASEARYLASTVAAIRGLRAAGAGDGPIQRLDAELHERYPRAREAIVAVKLELRRTRDHAVRLGGIIAPTAHEAALEMVLALNRERFGVEVIGRKCIGASPEADEVIAEIELEYTRATAGRGDQQPVEQPSSQPAAESGKLALAPGGFTLRGKYYSLTGRPLAMLHALLAARHRTATANQLREAMGVNDEDVDYPEQVIKDAATTLRAKLREAASDTGVACPDNPLPSTGRGKDLTYRLALD